MTVLAAIRRLPEAYRETLVLRLVEGMTGPEIAERTGLTPGSVRVNLHRGLQHAARGARQERQAVSGDYLWDGSGEPDPEIQRLEDALRPLRGTRPAPELGPRRSPPALLRRRLARPGRGRRRAGVALAAVVTRAAPARADAGWSLAWLEGDVVGPGPRRAGDAPRRRRVDRHRRGPRPALRRRDRRGAPGAGHARRAAGRGRALAPPLARAGRPARDDLGAPGPVPRGHAVGGGRGPRLQLHAGGGRRRAPASCESRRAGWASRAAASSPSSPRAPPVRRGAGSGRGRRTSRPPPRPCAALSR